MMSISRLLAVLVWLVIYATPGYCETWEQLMAKARDVSLAQADEAVRLGQAAIKVSHASGEVAETQARAHFLDILRYVGYARYLEIYVEQLNWLDSASLRTDRSESIVFRKVLLLARSELALVMNDLDSAIEHANKVLDASQTLPPEIIRTAKVLRGVALARRTNNMIAAGTLWADVPYAEDVFALLLESLNGPLYSGFELLSDEAKRALALIYTYKGDYQKAIEVYEQTAPNSSAPAVARARYFATLGSYYWQSGAVDKGKEYVDLAIATVAAIESQVDAGTAYLHTAYIVLWLGHSKKTVELFSKACDMLHRQVSGKELIVGYLQNARAVIDQFGLFDIGTSLYEIAVSREEWRNDPDFVLPLYAVLGRYYVSLREHQKLSDIIQAVRESNKIKPNGRATQDLSLSVAKATMIINPEVSAQWYRGAISTWNDPNDYSLLFIGLRGALLISMQLGNYQDAVDILLIGSTFGHALNKVPAEETIQFLLDGARAATDLGRLDLTRELLAIGEALVPELHPDWKKRISTEYAYYYALIGDEQLSLASLNQIQSLLSSATIGNPYLDMIEQYAHVFTELGNILRAEEALRACISVASTQFVRPNVEARCRYSLALLLSEADSATAEEVQRELDEMEKTLSKSEDVFATFEIHQQYTYDLVRGGFSEAAAGFAERALQLLKGVPSTVRTLTFSAAFESVHLHEIARRGSSPDYARLSLILRQIFSYPYLSVKEVRALFQIAIVVKWAGNTALSKMILTRLIERIEYVRGLIRDRTSKMLFGGNVSLLYDEITNQELLTGNTISALAIQEANRVRSISDLIVPKVATSFTNDANDQMQSRKVLESVRASGRTKVTTEEIRAAFDLLALIANGKSMKSDAIEVAQTTNAPELALDRIRENLGERDAVIVYYLNEEISGAWAVTKNSVLWHQLDGYPQLEKAIVRFRSEIASPEGSEVRRGESAEHLFELLLRPLLDHIGSKDRLIIIPDKALFGISFEAFVIRSENNRAMYLMEQYQIAYQFSLKLLAPKKHWKGETTKRALLIGAPISVDINMAADGTVPLAGALEELSEIRKAMGHDSTTMYVGKEATKEKIKSEASQYQILHLASHAVSNHIFPYRSHVKLADGSLFLWEVPELTLSADLVVLSACETGKGKALGGEGVWGFPSQFLSAGARNVVVTLWEVDDLATSRLMIAFYQSMEQKGHDIGAALRRAKLQMLTGERWKHPYYWAPFVVYGTD